MKEDLICCLLSKYAYKSQNALHTAFHTRPFSRLDRCLEGCTDPIFHSTSRDAQCFTMIHNTKFYIVFRGTESMRDWMSDANIIRVPMDLPGIPDNKRPRVHWGFLRQFRSLQPAIEQDLSQFLTRDSKTDADEIIIAGHSLGAAQCTLAGLQFKLAHPAMKVSCYTYGSPRVGNQAFVSMFHDKLDVCKRYVNEEDPVTMIPFAWRFTHIPGFTYLGKNGTMCTEKVEHRWWSMVKDLFLSLFGRENPVGDHSCDAYLEKLSSIFDCPSDTQDERA